MENGILVERKVSQSNDGDGGKGGKNGASPAGKKGAAARRRKWHAHNIAEYFFFNDSGQLAISEDTIRQTYSAYTTILSNAHKQLRINYEDLVAAAYGSHNPDAPMPLCVPAMKTYPLQHYLEDEMCERLGLKNEVFQSGSF